MGFNSAFKGLNLLSYMNELNVFNAVAFYYKF